MSPERRLVYKFYELSYGERIELAKDFWLIHHADLQLDEMDIWMKVFRGVKEKGIKSEFWDEVNKRTGSEEPNPFRKFIDMGAGI